MIYKLKDLIKIKYGKSQKKVECENGCYPIIGTGGEIGRSKDYLYNRPSVLIGRKGTIEKVKYIEEPFWTIDTLFYTEINEKIILPKYLYYKLSMINFKNYDEGTTIPSLRAETLYEIEIDIDDMLTQKKIVKILSKLEDKIKLNINTNDNLYELTMELFRKQFSEETQKDDSWRKVKLKKLISLRSGLSYKASKLTNNKNANILVSMGNVESNKIFNFDNLKYYKDEPEKRYMANIGDLFICTRDVTQKRNQLGCPGIIPKIFKGRKIIIGTNLYIVDLLTNDKSLVYYLFLLLNSKKYRERIMGAAKGTAILMITKDDILNFEFLYPKNEEVINQFNNEIEPFFKKIQNNIIENNKLTQLKNTLLPKLMNGKINLDEIDI